MKCRECERILTAYALGELAEGPASECRAHLERCAGCRETLASYEAIVRSVAAEPRVTVTASESAAMARALGQVPLRRRPVRAAPAPSVYGLLGFSLASVIVFALIAAMLGLQVLGKIDILSLAGPLSMARIALTMVIVVLVTSFLPIVVTAQRRPLNGLTFRK